MDELSTPPTVLNVDNELGVVYTALKKYGDVHCP